MESCPLVISHILAEFHPERATYTTLHNQSLLLNGLSKSAQTFTVGFVKLLSTLPIHIVVWGNFPFNQFISITLCDISLHISLSIFLSLHQYTCNEFKTNLVMRHRTKINNIDIDYLSVVYLELFQ